MFEDVRLEEDSNVEEGAVVRLAMRFTVQAAIGEMEGTNKVGRSFK